MGGLPPIPSTPSDPPPNDVGFTSAHATWQHRWWWWWLVVDPTLSQMSRTLFGDVGELYTHYIVLHSCIVAIVWVPICSDTTTNYRLF